MRVRILLSLITIGLLVAGALWLIRSTPIGQAPSLGSPLPSGAVALDGWTLLADAPVARLEVGTAVHDGRIWLAGGFEADGAATTAVGIFDPASGTWTDGPALPTAVHHAALVSDGERLVLVGGYGAPAFAATDAVWLLLPDADAWVAGPPLPEPRGAAAAAFDGERVVLAGGVGLDGVRGEIMTLAGDEWRTIGSLTHVREHLAAASDGAGSVWFMGGRQGGLETNVGDVDLVAGDEVRPLTSVTPRGGVAAFFAPGFGACLTGGEAPLRASTAVECVDAAGRLTALPSMNRTRHGHGAAVVDGVAYVLLGGPTPGLSVQSSVESLRLEP